MNLLWKIKRALGWKFTDEKDFKSAYGEEELNEILTAIVQSHLGYCREAVKYSIKVLGSHLLEKETQRWSYSGEFTYDDIKFTYYLVTEDGVEMDVLFLIEEDDQEEL